MSDADFHFLAEVQIEAARDWAVHQWCDHWWVVHPEKGLAFFRKGYASPQCNRSEEIARRLCPAWGKVKFFPRVLAPLNISDYQDR